jgi:ribonuclease BN (tRNA processing enzyme)
MRNSSRRELALGAGAMLMGEALPQFASAQSAPPSKTRLILLGTGGGPRPTKTRIPSSQVILVNEAVYVFDCGLGVTIQLVRAGVRPDSLRHVFITHHHSDHNAEYGPLLLTAWGSGLRTQVNTWGPPPLARMTELFLEMNEYDIRTRTEDEGRVPLAPLVHPHELNQAGLVLREEGVVVRCALVDHPPVTPAFAYRLDSPDRSIVISGDTKRSDALIGLAQGADVLVHEVMWPTAIDRLLAKAYNAAALKKSILSHHTAAEDAGRVAAQAGVKTLVLSHFVPSEDPELTDEKWVEAVRRGGYKGPIVAGKDLLEI